MKKTILIFLASAIMLFSCNKENASFLPEYQALQGIWNLESVSYDSAGIRITLQSKDRLRIEENLTYSLYMHNVDFIENGSVDIVDQNEDRLEIAFSPVFPSYYSFAGSRVFGYFNLELVSLSEHEMILKSVDPENPGFTVREYYFSR